MAGTVTVVGVDAAGGNTEAAPGTAAPAPAPPRGTGAPSAAPPRARARARRTTRAALADFRFAPAVIRVRAGGSVTWTNLGAAPHSVTALDGSFDSGMLAPHASWMRVFRRKGVFRVVCSVHPQMRAVVVVRASAPRRARVHVRVRERTRRR
jgi:plastocyanin